jgi:hypothetical protein
LESVCWGNSTVGSNPTLSAIPSAVPSTSSTNQIGATACWISFGNCTALHGLAVRKLYGNSNCLLSAKDGWNGLAVPGPGRRSPASSGQKWAVLYSSTEQRWEVSVDYLMSTSHAQNPHSDKTSCAVGAPPSMKIGPGRSCALNLLFSVEVNAIFIAEDFSGLGLRDDRRRRFLVGPLQQELKGGVESQHALWMLAGTEKVQRSV